MIGHRIAVNGTYPIAWDKETLDAAIDVLSIRNTLLRLQNDKRTVPRGNTQLYWNTLYSFYNSINVFVF